MTDRVPGAPGRYQAVITADQQEKLLSGEAFAITLTRDDQPIVEGTPYSKATVLPDAVAAQICPYKSDPTPADAFLGLKAQSDMKLCEDVVNTNCFYRLTSNGAITEWWNPPMKLGAEYRTTQRWNGNPLYTKLIDCGNMPAVGQTKTVPHETKMTCAIRCAGIMDPFTIPMDNPVGKVDVSMDDTNIYLKVGANSNDMSSYKAVVQIWYVK